MTRREGINVLLVAAFFVAAALLWNHTPERVPTHWNMAGEVDGWGGRFESLFVLPIIVTAVYGLLLLIPLVDREKMRTPVMRKTMFLLRLVLLLFFAAMYAISLVESRHPDLQLFNLTFSLIGLLFIGLGVVTPKIPPNLMMGVRTPGVFTSPEVWEKTQRFGGRLMVGMGVLLLPTALFPPIMGFGMLLGLSLLLVIWVSIYSYRLANKTGNGGGGQG